jgi:hypothetical protein
MTPKSGTQRCRKPVLDGADVPAIARDSALVAAVLGLGRQAILHGPDMLGRLMDTFVTAQLRTELAVSELGPRLYHLREEHGPRPRPGRYCQARVIWRLAL